MDNSTEELIVERDEPLIQTQDFNDISSLNADINTEDSFESDPKRTDEEWLDRIDSKNMPKVRIDSNLLSQQVMVNRMDEWRGDLIVNYKTFKKFSQNSSQTIGTEELVRLKRVENNCHKSESQIDEEVPVVVDNENSAKRKVDLDFDDSDVSSLKKTRVSPVSLEV